MAVSPTLIVTLGRDPTGFTQCRRRFLDSSISTTVVPALVAGTHWHQRAAMSCHNGISASRNGPTPEWQDLQTARALGPGNKSRDDRLCVPRAIHTYERVLTPHRMGHGT